MRLESNSRINASEAPSPRLSKQVAGTSSLHLISCPHCGNKFSAEDSIETELRSRLEQEFEVKHYEKLKAATERVRAEEESRFHHQMKQLEDDRQLKTKRLKSLEEKMITIEERERELK